MSENKVLVAYASKYGSTAQIAENIALRLRKAGLNSVVENVSEIRDLRGYSAVVLGSAVYSGNWMKEAADFLDHFQYELAKIPVWLFSAGPTGKGDPVERMKGWRFPESLKHLSESIRPRDIGFFHGVLDMSRLKLAERLIIAALQAPAGDFRDWDVINSWADGIAQDLQADFS